MPTPSPIQLTRAFKLPPEQAVKYLKGLGVEVTDGWREQQAAIRRQAFTVAKVTQAGLLQTMLGELQKGMESGKPWDQWQRETGKLLEAKGYARRPDGTAWRLDNIYRTNLQSAYQAGRYQQMQESTRFEYWEYRAVGDKRSRSEHRKLDGLILHRDHPFWKKAFPPNGYGCRCSVTALTLKQAVAKGYKPGQEPDWVKDWTPDEGFDGIPGQPFTPDTSALPPSVAKDLKKDLKDAPPAPKPTKPAPLTSKEAAEKIAASKARTEALKKETAEIKAKTAETRKKRKAVEATLPAKPSPGKKVSAEDMENARPNPWFSDSLKKADQFDEPRLHLEEKAALNAYTKQMYVELNEGLSRGSTHPQYQALRSIINGAVEKISEKHETLYRGLKFYPDDLKKFLDKHKEGETVTWEAFNSTSTSKAVAKKFGRDVVVTLKGFEGAKVKHLSDIPNESEVLVKAGAQVKVTSVTVSRVDGRDIYFVEVTPP